MPQNPFALDQHDHRTNDWRRLQSGCQALGQNAVPPKDMAPMLREGRRYGETCVSRCHVTVKRRQTVSPPRRERCCRLQGSGGRCRVDRGTPQRRGCCHSFRHGAGGVSRMLEERRQDACWRGCHSAANVCSRPASSGSSSIAASSAMQPGRSHGATAASQQAPPALCGWYVEPPLPSSQSSPA